WHAGICQSGAVRRRRTIAGRYSFRYLLVRRYVLVLAYRPYAVCWAHDGRNPRTARKRAAIGTAQETALAGSGCCAVEVHAGRGPKPQTAIGARATSCCP